MFSRFGVTVDHAVEARSGHSVGTARASRNLRADFRVRVERSRRKYCAGIKATSTPARLTGRYRKTDQEVSHVADPERTSPANVAAGKIAHPTPPDGSML